MDYVVTCVQQDTGAECAMCVPVRCGLCVCGCDVPPGASGSRSEPRLPRGPRRGALARERPRRVCARARLQGAPAGAASRGGCARLAADFRSLPGLLCPTAPRSAAGEARRAGRTGAPVPALSARGALGTPGSRGVRPCAAAAGAGRGGGGEEAGDRTWPWRRRGRPAGPAGREGTPGRETRPQSRCTRRDAGATASEGVGEESWFLSAGVDAARSYPGERDGDSEGGFERLSGERGQ